MSKNSRDFIDPLHEITLAARLKKLSDRLQQEVAQVYAALNIDFEPKWFAMLYLLYHEPSLSVVAVAKRLRLTHPAVVQFAQQMQRKKILRVQQDKIDGRKRNLSLTKKGETIYQNILPLLKDIEQANRKLLQETGYPVMEVIRKIESALDRQSMYERMQQRLQKKSSNC